MPFSTVVKIFLVFLIFLPLSLLSSQSVLNTQRISHHYEALEPLVGTWYVYDIGETGFINNTLTFTEVSYEGFYDQLIAKGLDQNDYQAQCLLDNGVYTSSNHTYICWNFQSADGLNDTYYSLSFVDDDLLQGMYYLGEYDDAMYSLGAGLGEIVVASSTPSSSSSTSQEDILNSNLTTLKNRLLSTKTYKVSGSFSPYDFAGVVTAFDWTFVTSDNIVYQLQGIAPTSNDVFGWKQVSVTSNEPTWYMSYLGDWDNDGSGKYDWILVANGFDAVYKLEGVTATGNFAYSTKIDIPYTVSSDKKTITFGSGSSDDLHYPGDLFEDIDEEALVGSVKSDIISTISNNATIDLSPKSTGILVSTSDVISQTTQYVILKANSGVTSQDINKPLFIDNVFSGMISTVQISGSNIEVNLKNADHVNDVYDNFSVEFRNDVMKKAVQRAITARQFGTYDHLNVNPLELSIIEKPNTNTRGLTSNELVLRIDIPQGYYVPIERKVLDCSFWDASCDFTLKGELKNKLELGKEYTKSGLTFSTAGSYMEIGLGSYIKAQYDHNTLTEDIYNFQVAQSAYFGAKMSVVISGELSSDWSTSFKLIQPFDIEIVHPYSAAVKSSVAVSPVITFGVEGKLKGSVTATSQVTRSGEIRFQYNSQGDSNDVTNTMKYTPQSLDKDSVEVSITAEGHAYIYPNILMIPNLKFLRINKPLTFIYVRSGIKLDNAVQGKIASGFVVENGDLQQTMAAEVSVKTSLYGLVQSRWMVRLGSIDFYNTSEYKDLYQTGALNILDWKAQLLTPPQVVIKESKDDPAIKELTFNSDEDTKIKGNLYFYYTLAQKDTSSTDIDLKDIEDHKPVWRIGDKAIEITENTIVKVRSVLYNRDISDSIWAWGTSVSKQVKVEVVNVMPPVFDQCNITFTDTLNVTLSQPQGYEIYYTLNGSDAQKYSGSITVNETVTIVAYARTLFDGEKFYSEEITCNFEKEGSHDTTDLNLWSNYPNPEFCPVSGAASGETYSSAQVVIINNDGEGNYVRCLYYGDGAIRMEQPYVNGEVNGMDKWWWENGNLRDISTRLNGKYHGWRYSFSEYGYLFYKVENKNGLMQGIYTRYDYYDGTLDFTVPYVDDEKHGIQIGYYETGELQYKEPYINGKIDGLRIDYYKSGSVLEETPYVSNPTPELLYAIQGTLKHYYESGELYFTQEYILNDQQGEEIFYAKDGTQISCTLYENDEEIGPCN